MVISISQPSQAIRLSTYLPCGRRLKSLDSSGFARRYFRNHWLFSLPQGTKMFQFPWFPLHTLYIQVRVHGNDSMWVSPFRNLWLKIY